MSGSSLARLYIVRVTDADNVLGRLVQSGDPDSVLDGRGAVNLDNASANPAPVQNLAQDFGYTARGQQQDLGLIGDTIFPAIPALFILSSV